MWAGMMRAETLGVGLVPGGAGEKPPRRTERFEEPGNIAPRIGRSSQQEEAFRMPDKARRVDGWRTHTPRSSAVAVGWS